MSQRPTRERKAPKPIYVPDESVQMEDDYSDDESVSLHSSCDGDDCDMSVDSGDTGPNEYVYDDFVVPDDLVEYDTESEKEESELDIDDEDEDEDSYSDSNSDSEATVFDEFNGN